ncbi:MAG: hypothetical protein JXB05_13590 [Myxococcaceae bacterium]|nr:hypothetical protein [Myxococcaceae bacterium]
MPLTFKANPSELKFPSFQPYSWKELRNQILFRLLARHGSLVASALEFSAQAPVSIEFSGKSVPAHGKADIHVNTPTKRAFYQAPYMVNPYQPPSENVTFPKYLGWKFAQPLILGGSSSDAKLAQATLKLDLERMKNGPFSQEPFTNEFEAFKKPAFRFFARSQKRLQWLMDKCSKQEKQNGKLAQETLQRLGALPKPLVEDLDDATSLTICGMKGSLFQHLVWLSQKPEQYPKEWSNYLQSEVRKSHHMYKSHQRLVAHYTQLEKRVAETTPEDSRPLTEARGEYLAAKVMAMIFAGDLFELKMGFGDREKAQGIDQIWARRDSKTNIVEAYFVIECKGSKSAKHGQNKEETQMSPGWVFKKLVELASDRQAEERLRRLAQKILSAMFDEANQVAVFGMTIKSIFDKEHTQQTAARFNVQISKQLRFPKLLDEANTQASKLDDVKKLFGSSAFPSVKSAEFGILESMPPSSMKLDVPTNFRFQEVHNAFALEHPRNKELFSLLTAHAASILSVQDYFGIKPQQVNIDGNGKLRSYSGFATTIYGGNNTHSHELISTLVDPYDKDSTGSGALLLEYDDKEDAKLALAWKQKALKQAPDTSRPQWMKNLVSAGSSPELNELLLFFAKRPLARQELRRIWKEGMVDEPEEETQLAFPNLPTRWFRWKVGNTPVVDRILAMKETWDRFTHHSDKSLNRLGQHYKSLKKKLEENKANTVLTEVSGEYLGARAMAVIFGKDRLQLKMGHGEKKGSHGVDQIWARRDPSTGDVVTYFLVECKGSKDAELGQNVHETQMSPAWIFRKMLELAQDGGRLRRLSEKVLSAIFDPVSKVEVYGVIIQSLFNPKKAPEGRFNIRLTSRLFFPDLLKKANDLCVQKLRPDHLYSRILHERMPLSEFLPDYVSTPIPVKKSSLAGTKYFNEKTRHQTRSDYPITKEQVTALAELGTSQTRLYTHAVSPDGDCAYNTARTLLERVPGLLTQLGRTRLPTVDDLKDLVVAEIDASVEFAKRFLNKGETLAELKKKVKERHLFFGAHGDIVLPALARQLGLCIHVIHPNGNVENLDQSLGLGLPQSAPKVYTVLTTYLGNPGSVAHYYPAVPLRLLPSSRPGASASNAGRKSQTPGSTPKKQQELKRTMPKDFDSGGSKGTSHGDKDNNKRQKQQ